MLYDPLGELLTKRPTEVFVRCIVPTCKNDWKTNKLFLFIPFDPNTRREWLLKLKLDLFPRQFLQCYKTDSNIFCCEDHFQDVKEQLPKPFECLALRELQQGTATGQSTKRNIIPPVCVKVYDLRNKNIHNVVEDEMNLVLKDKLEEFHPFSIKEENMDLNENVDISLNNGMFSCGFCFQEFLDNDALQLHIQENHLVLDIKPEIFQCNKCSSSFVDESEILEHLEKDHKNGDNLHRKIINQLDNSSISSLYTIKENLLDFIPKTFECDRCSMIFLYKMSLDLHKRQKKTLIIRNIIRYNPERPSNSNNVEPLNVVPPVKTVSKSVYTEHTVYAPLKHGQVSGVTGRFGKVLNKDAQNMVDINPPHIYQISKTNNQTSNDCNVNNNKQNFINVFESFVQEIKKEEERDSGSNTLACETTKKTSVKDKSIISEECSSTTASVGSIDLLQCYFCCLEFIDKNSLSKHIREIHVNITPKYIQCKACLTCFKDEDGVIGHINVCTKIDAELNRFKTAKSPGNKQNSIIKSRQANKSNKHNRGSIKGSDQFTLEENYKCNNCSGTIGIRECVKEPYCCKYCNIPYSDRKRKRKTCGFCKRIFKSDKGLKIHLRTHNKKR